MRTASVEAGRCGSGFRSRIDLQSGLGYRERVDLMNTFQRGKHGATRAIPYTVRRTTPESCLVARCEASLFRKN